MEGEEYGRRTHHVHELGVVAPVVALDLLDGARPGLVGALQVVAAVRLDDLTKEIMKGGRNLVGLLDQRVDVGERSRLLGRGLLAVGLR